MSASSEIPAPNRLEFSDNSAATSTELPPGLDVDPEDTGTCASCGSPTYRPPGQSPTGRKLRIPKYCESCKPSKSAAKPGATRRRRGVDIEGGMTELYTSVGLILATRDPELGTMIVGPQRMKTILEAGTGEYSLAVDAGRAWANVAANNPAVANVLEKMLATGVWAELGNAHVPLVALAVQRKPKLLTRVRNYISDRRTGRTSKGGRQG